MNQSASLLFKINADASDAKRELNAVEAAVGSLGGQFTSMSGLAAIGTAAVTAVATAAVAAGAAMVRLAFDASEYGSQLFDVQEKTKLSAETLSTLRLAAENSGSSFDAIGGSISKFAVLLGQANQGNEKANATLEKYGITARDIEGALTQVIAVIGNETDATLQAAAAKDLLKDRTGAIIPVINQLGGDLKKATEDAKRLGLTLSDDNVKAADDLGDAWGVLSAQLKAGASKFALEYAPMISNAIKEISEFLARNQAAWAEWGRNVSNTMTGTIVVMRLLGKAANDTFDAMTFGLLNQQQKWDLWGNAIRVVVYGVTGGLSEILRMLNAIGAMKNLPVVGAKLNTGPMEAVGGASPASTTSSSVKAGGGGGGGGAAQTAEQLRQKEVQDEEKKNSRLVAAYRAFLDQQEAEFKSSYQKKFISEERYTKAVAELRLKELIYQLEINKKMLAGSNLSVDERTEYEHKQSVLNRQIGTEKIKIANDVYEVISKNTKKELDDFQKAEDEKERIRKEKRDRRNRQAQEDADEDNRRLQALRENTANAGIDTGFFEGIANAIAIMTDRVLDARAKMASAINQIKASWQSMGDIVGSAVNSFAQGVGSIVQNLVLMGSAGPNAMRKLTASVLAGVAAQSAVLAIFELAKGFAALWFNPAEAAAHFKAAALFGVIAIGTGLAGRAVAGDSFKSETSSATGGGSSGNGESSESRYTTAFGGYTQLSNAISQQNGIIKELRGAVERTTVVLGGVEEVVHTLGSKVRGMSPGDVVAMGAKDASRDIRDAYESELGSDSRATEGLMRQVGWAR